MAAEPKTAEWWEGQWGQLKAELDALNPKYDAATARVRELEAAVADARTARDAAAARADSLSAELAAAVSGKDALKADCETMAYAIGKHRDEADRQKARADRLLESLHKVNAIFAPAVKVVIDELHGSV